MVDSYAVPEPLAARADGAPLLSPSVTSALRSWLDERHRTHGSAPVSVAAIRTDGATRRVLRQLCEDAYRHGVRVEQVIVLLKQLWATLPDNAGPEHRHAARELLDGIVSVCIEEFYAPARSAANDGRAARATAGSATSGRGGDGSTSGS